MALTSTDETDLLLPLFGVQEEDQPFSAFLERLRRRAGVVSASITIRPGDGHVALSLFAGRDLRQHALALDLEVNLIDRIHYDRLRPGRVYSGDEFDDHDPLRKARRLRDMRQLGVVDERVVRLLDGEVSAWLILASARACTAADSALLSSLAPYVAAAVRSFVAAQRARLAGTLDAAGLQRAGAGWIVFDKAARVLGMAAATRDLLAATFGHPPHLGQRLRELGPTTERALGEAAAAFALAPDAPARTLVLVREPRIEAILAAAPPASATIMDVPAMVATCRQVRVPSAARSDHLARLHDLPRREAELAILLADGLSLAEAGAAMGLTIETARNYSKRLFAKVGVRGQAELVRAVYESCAMLA